MRIISKTIDISVQDQLLQASAPLSDFLVLDIETTGLSAEKNAVYLIGCIYLQLPVLLSWATCFLFRLFSFL